MAQAVFRQGASVLLQGFSCIFSILTLLFSLSAAFYIDNEGKDPIVAVQLPISANSYLQVIPVGETSDCDWTECGQFSVSPGRCDPAYFCIFPDNLGVDWNATIKADLDSIAIVNNATRYLGLAIIDGELDVADNDAYNAILNTTLPCVDVAVTYNDGGIYYGELSPYDSFDYPTGFWSVDDNGDMLLVPPPGTANCTFNSTGNVQA